MPNAQRLPSRVEFASFLVYSPRGTSDVCRTSRLVRDAVKRDTAQWARRQRLAVRLRDEVGASIRERFLAGNATLVPMPGHAPMKDPKSHWSSRELCGAFVAVGLGARWLPLLERIEPVAKSAFARPEDRPNAERHYQTMRARHDLSAGAIITVVDDVVTRGATMLAAIGRLREKYPRATVRGFALLRTMTDQDIERVKEPCEGTITVVRWGTKRDP